MDATEEVWSFGINVLVNLLERSLEEQVNVHGGEMERKEEWTEAGCRNFGCSSGNWIVAPTASLFLSST